MTREEKQLIMDAVGKIQRLAHYSGNGRFEGHYADSIRATAQLIAVRRGLVRLLESMCDD